MPFLMGLILSLIQGITEFLPVSSSGHLAIFQIFSKSFKEPPVFFDIFLHLATLFSILFYYRKNLKNYFNLYKIILILSGMAGTFLVAFPLKDFAKQSFSSPYLISLFLFITGIILYLANGVREKNKEMDIRDAFLIGIFQGFAIFPGISRSGITISTGIFLGISSEVACEFSFILSIPVILGANLLEALPEIKKYGFMGDGSFLIFFLITFLLGLIFLHFTNKIFIKRYLKPFSFYCIIISVLIFGVVFYGKFI
ncbi:MAG: undecaprenyl-diphosphate phosphatase [Thermoanaerobaculia bacterium]